MNPYIRTLVRLYGIDLCTCLFSYKRTNLRMYELNPYKRTLVRLYESGFVQTDNLPDCTKMDSYKRTICPTVRKWICINGQMYECTIIEFVRTDKRNYQFLSVRTCTVAPLVISYQSRQKRPSRNSAFSAIFYGFHGTDKE